MASEGDYQQIWLIDSGLDWQVQSFGETDESLNEAKDSNGLGSPAATKEFDLRCLLSISLCR